MENILDNKVAVLTGGGGGIGRATAEKLAQHKLQSVLLGGNNLKNLQETAAIVEKYSNCLMLPGDLTDADFIGESIEKIAEKFHTVDVLINNAGVAQSTPFEDITLPIPKEYDKWLIQIFGDYMILSPIKEQVGFHFLGMDFGKY